MPLLLRTDREERAAARARFWIGALAIGFVVLNLAAAAYLLWGR